jgi:hydroxymethylpyrimidine/phosphomethylpyrimidine kinase
MQRAREIRRGRTPRVLSIAGSDSGGGAGIQADLKAFARCGVHGMTAITAITAQNTVEVTDVQAVVPGTILAQVRAVCQDIGVDAVKVGMLGEPASAQAVARALEELDAGTPIVVDPVMVSESGGRLLSPGAERVLIERILPLASVATPNLPEARALTGEQALDGEQLVAAVLALGPACVVLTGGHRDEAVDLFGSRAAPTVVEIAGERHPDGAAHGSGCTHSSALAAALALGHEPLRAAEIARALAGQGAGPVDVIGLARARAALHHDISSR